MIAVCLNAFTGHPFFIPDSYLLLPCPKEANYMSMYVHVLNFGWLLKSGNGNRKNLSRMIKGWLWHLTEEFYLQHFTDNDLGTSIRGVIYM